MAESHGGEQRLVGTQRYYRVGAPKVTKPYDPPQHVKDRVIPVYSPDGELLGWGGKGHNGGLVVFDRDRIAVTKAVGRLMNGEGGRSDGPHPSGPPRTNPAHWQGQEGGQA